MKPFMMIWIGFLGFILILGCGRNMEKEEFGVYLVPKNGKEEFLGDVIGLSNCKLKAENVAPYKNLVEFGYYCCLKTGNSKCASKHK